MLNTIGRFELFPTAGTVVVFRFVLLESGWSILNEFGGLQHARVKKWNMFSQIPRQRETRGSAHWACIAHLTIEWYWSKFQREIIITLKNSSHLEWRVGLSDTILKGTHPWTIYAKVGSIWPSCFRGEDFFNISQSEKRIILGGQVYRPNGTKWRNFIEDLT